MRQNRVYTVFASSMQYSFRVITHTLISSSRPSSSNMGRGHGRTYTPALLYC